MSIHPPTHQSQEPNSNEFKPGKLHLTHTEFRKTPFLVKSNEIIGWRIITKNEFENFEINHLEKLIRPTDICIDVGGNIGIYAVFMALKATKGTVHSFEPIKVNRDIIKINSTLNNLENICIYDSVLGNTIGPIQFSESLDSAYSSVKATGRCQESSLIEVNSTTLDELFFRQNKGIDVLKIDVEGADLLVLEGAKQLLCSKKLRPRAILVESVELNQKVYDYTEEDLVTFLTEINYTPHVITEHNLEPYKSDRKTTDEILFLSSNPQVENRA